MVIQYLYTIIICVLKLKGRGGYFPTSTEIRFNKRKVKLIERRLQQVIIIMPKFHLSS